VSSAAAALLQLAVILGLAHVMGALFRRIGQPRVVGEMVAGMLLGPSALGWLAPRVSQLLFPHESLGSVAVLSQLAVVLFVYLIGVRLETEHLRQHSRLAIVTSNVSVFLPFLMGLGLAFFLYPQTEQPRGAFLPFALFVGTAISITAFPVLARILEERNLVATRLGSIAITCAAFGDATAWVLVASIVALVKNGSNSSALVRLAVYTAIYSLFMFLVVRPILKRYPPRSVVVFVLVALVSAFAAEWIGLHALIGALIAGLITPRAAEQRISRTLEGATFLLLPLFFASTGLHTDLRAAFSAGHWAPCVMIILVSALGKFGGAMFAAQTQGMAWRDAAALGALMNTRGLVELVILNLGLETRILPQSLYSMLVLMALVTTAMAGPILDGLRVGVPSRAPELVRA
jgi:Kef-type K+ transport system membrane component KefB